MFESEAAHDGLIQAGFSVQHADQNPIRRGFQEIQKSPCCVKKLDHLINTCREPVPCLDVSHAIFAGAVPWFLGILDLVRKHPPGMPRHSGMN
jgi:hypothetical protein